MSEAVDDELKVHTPVVPKPAKKPRKPYPRKPKNAEKEVQVASRTIYELISKEGSIEHLVDPFPVWSPSRGDVIRYKGKRYEVGVAEFDPNSPTVIISVMEIEQ